MKTVSVAIRDGHLACGNCGSFISSIKDYGIEKQNFYFIIHCPACTAKVKYFKDVDFQFVDPPEELSEEDAELRYKKAMAKKQRKRRKKSK